MQSVPLGRQHCEVFWVAAVGTLGRAYQSGLDDIERQFVIGRIFLFHRGPQVFHAYAPVGGAIEVRSRRHGRNPHNQISGRATVGRPKHESLPQNAAQSVLRTVSVVGPGR